MKKEALGRTNRLRLGSKTGVRYALSEERSNLRREARKEGRKEGRREEGKEGRIISLLVVHPVIF